MTLPTVPNSGAVPNFGAVPKSGAVPSLGAEPSVGASPMRTCIGCREKAPASTLLRVVAVDGIVIPDPRRRLPGRGAWLHSRLECLDAAERRRAFGRAFRLAGPSGSRAVDAVGVRSLLTSKAGRPVVSTP